MKRHFLIAALLGALSPALHAQKHGSGVGPDFLPKNLRPPATDRVTGEEFLRQRAARERGRPARPANPPAIAPAERPPVPEGSTNDLLTTSTIIKGMNTFTLVPRNSVIHISEAFNDRIISAPSGRFQIWGEFLVANRGWVQTHEVTVEHARGLEPFDEATLKSFASRHGIVVATYNSGPISVNSRPPAEAEVDAEPVEDAPPAE